MVGSRLRPPGCDRLLAWGLWKSKKPQYDQPGCKAQRRKRLHIETYRYSGPDASDIHLRNAAGAGPDPVRQMEAFARSVIFGATDRNTAGTPAEVSDRYIRALSQWMVEIHAGRGEMLTPEKAVKLAIGANAVIAQLSRERSLDPARMTSAEALQVALDMIGARIGVDFAAANG